MAWPCQRPQACRRREAPPLPPRRPIRHSEPAIWRPTSGQSFRSSATRIAPAIALFFTFYVIFVVLTPARYRKRGCRKWPGVLLITSWWIATVELLPGALELLGGYDLTYGSLAGVMIALIFFFMTGLGVVTGAELNAALAESDGHALKGEVYTGPYADELEVDEPEPGEDVKPVVQGIEA